MAAFIDAELTFLRSARLLERVRSWGLKDSPA
jgi:hypothetical protein